MTGRPRRKLLGKLRQGLRYRTRRVRDDVLVRREFAHRLEVSGELVEEFDARVADVGSCLAQSQSFATIFGTGSTLDEEERYLEFASQQSRSTAFCSASEAAVDDDWTPRAQHGGGAAQHFRVDSLAHL